MVALHKDSGAEKRERPRWPLPGRLSVAPIDDAGQVQWGAAQQAAGRNISTDGLAFVGSGLPPCQRVLLTIPTGGQPVQVQAEVRHWQSLEGNVVEVGCRFERPAARPEERPETANGLVSPELAGLVDRIAEKHRAFAERRVATRVPYTECIGVELPSGESVRGFGRDLSRGGIAFFTTAGLPHELVRLTLPQVGGEQPLAVRARIVRCTRLIEGFHEVAAQFLPV
jgi:hypothetical protein